MKNIKLLIPFIIMMLLLSGCEGSEDFNAGIAILSCDLQCGKLPVCQSSRGDMIENEKTSVQFPFGYLFPDVVGSQAPSMKSRKSVNATLKVTVEGEGTVNVIIQPENGSTIEKTVSKDSPLVITEDFQIKIKKFDEESDSMEIVGIQVEAANGPAQGVHLDMTINECLDDYCASTSPYCK
jgi:hypothetical protein